MSSIEGYLTKIDFFGMVDRHWADHEKDGLVEASPMTVLIENCFEWSEEDIAFVTDYFLEQMRQEYPNSILVCHL